MALVATVSGINLGGSRRLLRTRSQPATETNSSVIKVMRVIAIVFGFDCLANLVSGVQRFSLLLQGVFAPLFVGPAFNVALNFVAAGLYLNAARLLFQSNIYGIRWGFFCLGFAAVVLATGRGGLVGWVVVLSLAAALKWCDERVAEKAPG